VSDLASIRKRYAKGIRLACNGNASAERLAEILQPFRPGATPITVRFTSDRIGGDIELPESWRVNPDDALIDRLREWLAPENVQVVY
jgi:DNA polymerase III subunit alpha